MVRMDAEELKRQGYVWALVNAIKSRQHDLVNAFDDTERNGRYCGLGIAVRKAQTVLSEINELLKELQKIDPKVT